MKTNERDESTTVEPPPVLARREPATEGADPYRGEPELGSVVSYPDRAKQWGDGRYRGNCDGRLFLNLVLQYGPRRIADPMMGSGTTRDVIAGLNTKRTAPLEFWGGDLNMGFDLTRDSLPGKFDLVWLHPPYWNIIEYGNGPSDLSAIGDYAQFLTRLTDCLCRCFDALNPGGRLAVLIADVRRSGKYYPLGRDVMNLDSKLGDVRSVIIKTQHNCRSDSRSYYRLEDPRIRHEYCIVFKRPVPMTVST